MQDNSKYLPLLIAGLLISPGVLAGKPDVVDVKVECTSDNRCNFSVSVLHKDEGWDHYADRWEVIGPNNVLLGTRILLHPHVHEQPFTRSLSNVDIPMDIDQVTVRAHDKVHGYGGKEMEVHLPPR